MLFIRMLGLIKMIIDTQNKTVYIEQNISEQTLQDILIQNFELFFPSLKLLESEFVLQGDVRRFGMSGRIDILALNKKNNQLVIFELKTNHSKNILIQALDYTDFIEIHKKNILHQIKNITKTELDILLKNQNQVEIILIAKKFSHPTFRRVEKINQSIHLYEYKSFENNLLQLTETGKLNKEQKLSQNINEIRKVDLTAVEILSIIKGLLELGLVSSDFYKIESGILTFNPTQIYKSYIDFILDQNEIPVSKSDFFKILKQSDSYLGNPSSVRFGKKRTSAMRLKI